ncbi:MAG: DinB family protein [Dehalococcoidia bacterium]|nr:DinB family protein [Dehalococcoidia bacterium]
MTTSDGLEAPQSMQQYLALFSARALDGIVSAIEDLSREELHARASERSNSIGWEAWHVFRSADNLLHFVFYREQPLWLVHGLDEAWGLPRVEQGTGMAPEVAHALVFPEPSALAGYGRDVRSAVVARIEAMSDADLQARTLVRPWGEVTRQEAIGQVLIAHGNGHLGQISTARELLGRNGVGI